MACNPGARVCLDYRRRCVANNTTLNVYELLLAVNRRAVNGVLYNGDMSLRVQAQVVFDALNYAGGVG
jgi:hypothetical protein